MKEEEEEEEERRRRIKVTVGRAGICRIWKHEVDTCYVLGTVEASCENTVFTVETYNKVNNYLPAIDRIVSEFKSLFAENDSVVLCALGQILTDDNLDDEAFKEAVKFYNIDEDTLRSDHI